MPIPNNLKTPIAGDTFRFDGSEWQLVQGGIGPVVGPDPSNAVPTVVNGEDGYQGGSLLYSRGDHRHELSFIGETKGDLIYFDGTNWNRLVAGVEGDVLTTHGTTSAPTWTALPILSTAAPINVDNSAASAGVSTSLSRSDHKHSTNTGVGISVGTVNNEGSATTLARSDHSHIVNDLNIPGQSSGKVLEFNGSNWAPATVSAVLGSAIHGQALIYDGSNWIAGGGLNLIDNYLAAQNLRTDGYISTTLIQAKNKTSFNSRGENLTLSSGTGTAVAALAPDGYVIINRGAQTVAKWATGITASSGASDDFIAFGKTPASFGAMRWSGSQGSTGFTSAGSIFGRNLANNVDAPVLNWGFDQVALGGGSFPTLITGTTINAIAATSIGLFLNGGAGTASITLSGFNFGFGSGMNASLNGGGDTVNSNITAKTTSLIAGSATQFNTRGGSLQLSSGTGTSLLGAPDGYVFINRGATTVAQWQTGISGSDDFIAFGKTTAASGNIRLPDAGLINSVGAMSINATNISLINTASSYQSMSGGLFINNSSIIPTGNPASGFYLYGNPSNNHPYIRTSDGLIVDLTNSGSLPSATHGQALIYDGSAWTAGGSGAIGSNYYFNKNLVTDGYISSDNLKARGSLLTIGDGSGSITYSATSSGTGHTFEIDGGFNLVIDNTSVRTTTDTIAYSTFNTNNQKYLTIDSTNVSSITAGTFNIQGQSATGAGSNGGAIQISAGGGGSGGKSGSIFLSGYNIGLIGSSVADGHGVIAVGNATTAPTTNPSLGHIYYSDSGLPTFRTSGGNVIKFDGTVTSTASLGSLTIPTLAQGYMTIVLGGTSYKIALYNT